MGGGGDGGDGTIRGGEKPFLPSASALAIPWGGVAKECKSCECESYHQCGTRSEQRGHAGRRVRVYG